MAIGDPIPGVSPNELIRTTWGNSVAQEINSNVIKKAATGSPAEQTHTGTLVVVGPSATGTLKLRRTTSNQPAVWFESTGAVFYGSILGTATGLIFNTADATDTLSFQINSIEEFSINQNGIAVGTAFNVTSGLVSVTGTRLEVNSSSGNECVRIRSSTPEYTLYNEAGTSEYGHLAGSSGGLNLFSVNDLSFSTTSAIRMSIVGNAVLVGKSAVDAAVAGVETYSGANAGILKTTIDTAGQTNVELRHTATADAVGELYVSFRRSTGTLAGSIAQGTGNAIVLNDTSDYRLKDDLGPIVDALDKVNALQPKHLAWKEDGAEFDGFIAHEVQAVIPAAVTGDKDAVLPPDDPDDPGGIDAQQLATSTLIPFLVAAIQQLSARIDALEGG